MDSIKQRLAALPDKALGQMQRGVEKESLRVDARSLLATTPHPAQLGSALTHPHITTDFSEAQLELITGVNGSAQACLDELVRIHQATYAAIGDESMWVASMPCKLPADELIPLGQYGSSNIGRMKTAYRMGLGHRYGRRMQTISGIHYNWSMPGLGDQAYFDLIRNFRRHFFLLLLLFGASPAVCKSFVDGREHALQPLSPHTLYMPNGTSLRMGRLGYQSDAQATLAVSYNNLESYAASLHEALTRPYAAYEAIGLRGPGGEYRQLSTTLLQIENEFYGAIRPKRVIRRGERPLHALRQRGVEYVEVRCMDLDPFESVGIAADTMRFIDIFLLHCLLHDSPPDTPAEIAMLGLNQHLVAARGREPGLRLLHGAGQVSLLEWAQHLIEQCQPIAQRLDALHGQGDHALALAQAGERLRNMAQLPSARVLAEMKRSHADSHLAFVAERSRQNRSAMLELPWPAAAQQVAQEAAQVSLRAQAEIEAANESDFESFRQAYLATSRLLPHAGRQLTDATPV